MARTVGTTSRRDVLTVVLTIVGIAVVNLVLRSVFANATHPTAPHSDFSFYFHSAQGLADHHAYLRNGKATSFWPIGWPLFLATTFVISGVRTYAFAMHVQVVLASTIGVMLFVVGRRLFGFRAGLAAAIVWTVLPSSWTWSTLLGTEMLFSLLVLLGLFALATLDGAKKVLVGGVLIGLACWVRPTMIFFPAALFVAGWLYTRKPKRALIEAVAVGAVMCVVIAPITIRNYLRFHEFIPVASEGGQQIWQGIHTDYGFYYPRSPALNPMLKLTDEEAQDKLGRHLFIEYVTHHPVSFLSHVPHKWVNLYRMDSSGWGWLHNAADHHDAQWARTWGRVSNWVYAVVMLLALYGITRAWRRNTRATVTLLTFLVYYTLLFGAFPVSDRYRYPMTPVFMLFAGVAVTELLSWRRSNAAAGSPDGDDVDLRRLEAEPSRVGG